MARKEEFLPDGRRVVADPLSVVKLWKASSVAIPAQYAVGTAQHESNFTVNEKDTEESGFVSWGIYQISSNEAKEVDFAPANLLTLEDSTIVFARLAERNMIAVLQTAKLSQISIDKLPLDIWAYVAIAHNQGREAAVKSILLHGLNFVAYIERNIRAQQDLIDHTTDTRARIKATAKLAWYKSVDRYGKDVMSGGPSWRPEFASV